MCHCVFFLLVFLNKLHLSRCGRNGSVVSQWVNKIYGGAAQHVDVISEESRPDLDTRVAQRRAREFLRPRGVPLKREAAAALLHALTLQSELH